LARLATIVGQLRLARARRPHDDEEASTAGDRVVEPRLEGGDLRVAADDRSRSVPPGRCHGGRPSALDVERRVLREDRLLQLLQCARRLDAQLPEERLPRVAIRGQRLRLAARPVEREHELPAEALPHRMARHEGFELRDELFGAPTRELRLDSIFDRRDAQLLEPDDLVLREGLVGEVAERRASPQLQRRTELLRRLLLVARGERGPPLRQRLLEAVAVELAGANLQRVGPADGTQRFAAAGELLPQRRNAVLEDLRGRGRRALPPQPVDDHVAGQRPVGVEEEQRQDRALPRSAERELPLAVERLERPENAVIHAVLRLNLHPGPAITERWAPMGEPCFRGYPSDRS
jgi:hypothetical protein